MKYVYTRLANRKLCGATTAAVAEPNNFNETM